MRTAKTLIRLGKCPAWSESSLGAHSFCWFCHVAAHEFLWSCVPSSISCTWSNVQWIFIQQKGLCWRWDERSNDLLEGQNLYVLWKFERKRTHYINKQFFTVVSIRSSYDLLLVWDCMCISYEPPHDKISNVVVRPAKTQISLGIRPVWSESSLSAWRKLGSLATDWAHSEDSDLTGRIPRLTWVFAGRTVILMVLSRGGSYGQSWIWVVPSSPMPIIEFANFPFRLLIILFPFAYSWLVLPSRPTIGIGEMGSFPVT